jgi:hypothetical protein
MPLSGGGSAGGWWVWWVWRVNDSRGFRRARGESAWRLVAEVGLAGLRQAAVCGWSPRRQWRSGLPVAWPPHRVMTVASRRYSTVPTALPRRAPQIAARPQTRSPLRTSAARPVSPAHFSFSPGRHQPCGGTRPRGGLLDAHQNSTQKQCQEPRRTGVTDQLRDPQRPTAPPSACLGREELESKAWHWGVRRLRGPRRGAAERPAGRQ